jgi:hypothetical protein
MRAFMAWEPKMRIASVIFVGSVAAMVMAAPAAAKHPEAQKTDENQSTSPSCHAYQQAADGSWTQLPCQEFGNGQTQHKPVAKGSEDEPR